MYNKVETNMNFVDREKQTEKFWEDHDIFKKSMEQRKQGETYTFYDGPPTANGKPHIGHVLTRVIKDMIPRYQTMKGKYVPRKGAIRGVGVRALEMAPQSLMEQQIAVDQHGDAVRIRAIR